MSESKGWFCYILEGADYSYVRVATDVPQHEHEHNLGHGAKHARLRPPVPSLKTFATQECLEVS
jgi:predicted GIY-YIG superfamily endonuclease